MAYSADSFSAGEQPTLAKWNKLWANDASFNDGTGIAAGAITPAKLLTGTGATWATATITPTMTGWSSTVKNSWQWIQMGKMVWLYFYVDGTSNSVNTNVTLPVAARVAVANGFIEGTYGFGLDNSGTVITQPRWVIDHSISSTLCSFYTSYAGGPWTASGSKQIRGFIIYEAA